MNDTRPHDGDRPDWWAENERLRDEMDLPAYRPPRFRDGTHAFEVCETLERRFECTIQLLGLNTQYPDDWEVRVDGERVCAIGRHRDDKGNTVYEMTPAEFEREIASHVEG